MSTRRAPLPAPPPPYTFFARVYKRSFRPIVFITAVVASIWCLALAVAGWRELIADENDHFPKLAPLAIVQGVLYTVALLFQLLGIVAGITQRIKLIRLYAYLCALSTLFVVSVGLMRVVTHFTYKNDLILECEDFATNGTVDWAFGLWGNNLDSNLTPSDAVSYCNDMWSRNSWAEILLTIFLIVVGVIFTAVAFGYYRQALDPTSPVNASRAPPGQYQMGTYAAYDSYSRQPDDHETNEPPKYHPEGYTAFDYDKKDDAFGDSMINPPRPTHWAEASR